MRRRIDSGEPLIVPFTVVYDCNEQLPYHFTGLHADAAQKNRPLVIPLEKANLYTGDYSLKGMEGQVAIERKTIDDLFGTLGGRRKQFSDELQRLNDMEFAAVVIEASWERIISDPPVFSRLTPKNAVRSILAWQQKFRGVHWITAGNRPIAEQMTFRILQRFYSHQVKNG